MSNHKTTNLVDLNNVTDSVRYALKSGTKYPNSRQSLYIAEHPMRLPLNVMMYPTYLPEAEHDVTHNIDWDVCCDCCGQVYAMGSVDLYGAYDEQVDKAAAKIFAGCRIDFNDPDNCSCITDAKVCAQYSEEVE